MMRSVNREVIAGRYQSGDSIGKGAFGRVFRGLDVSTGQVVAIKQVDKSLLSKDQLPAIMRELDLLRQLDHKNIVKLWAYEETKQSLFFIMEYIEGGSLHDAKKRFGTFPELLLVRYIADTLDGLAYLHSKRVIHRDIKGANILLTKEGVCKLADFGSCTYAAVDRKLTMIGTPFWMAPELIAQSGGSIASDVWSLGCTIIELLTGHPPYWKVGPNVALFRMVEDKHPPLPPSCSQELSDFLLACFVRNEHKRPSARELLQSPWILRGLAMAMTPVEVVQAQLEEEASLTRSRSSSDAAKSLRGLYDAPPPSAKKTTSSLARNSSDVPEDDPSISSSSSLEISDRRRELRKSKQKTSTPTFLGFWKQKEKDSGEPQIVAVRGRKKKKRQEKKKDSGSHEEAKKEAIDAALGSWLGDDKKSKRRSILKPAADGGGFTSSPQLPHDERKTPSPTQRQLKKLTRASSSPQIVPNMRRTPSGSALRKESTNAPNRSKLSDVSPREESYSSVLDIEKGAQAWFDRDDRSTQTSNASHISSSNHANNINNINNTNNTSTGTGTGSHPQPQQPHHHQQQQYQRCSLSCSPPPTAATTVDSEFLHVVTSDEDDDEEEEEDLDQSGSSKRRHNRKNISSSSSTKKNSSNSNNSNSNNTSDQNDSPTSASSATSEHSVTASPRSKTTPSSPTAELSPPTTPTTDSAASASVRSSAQRSQTEERGRSQFLEPHHAEMTAVEIEALRQEVGSEWHADQRSDALSTVHISKTSPSTSAVDPHPHPHPQQQQQHPHQQQYDQHEHHVDSSSGGGGDHRIGVPMVLARRQETVLQTKLQNLNVEKERLEKSIEKLQKDLIETMKDVEDLKSKHYFLRDLSSKSVVEKHLLEEELKAMLNDLLRSADEEPEPDVDTVDWIVPGAMCQVRESGAMEDGVVVGYRSDSAKAPHYQVVVIGSGQLISVKVNDIAPPREGNEAVRERVTRTRSFFHRKKKK